MAKCSFSKCSLDGLSAFGGACCEQHRRAHERELGRQRGQSRPANTALSILSVRVNRKHGVDRRNEP